MVQLNPRAHLRGGPAQLLTPAESQTICITDGHSRTHTHTNHIIDPGSFGMMSDNTVRRFESHILRLPQSTRDCTGMTALDSFCHGKRAPSWGTHLRS